MMPCTKKTISLAVFSLLTTSVLAQTIPGYTEQSSANFPPPPPPSGTAPQNPAGQAASLVAPIALYPDPLLAQILMASTYPLEVAEAYNWQTQNPKLSGAALANALKTQNWDPSVKSLLSFPSVLKMMGTQLNWVQSLGNTYLADPKGTMATIQGLRERAKSAGSLNSNSQQTVTTQPADGGTASNAIVIQPANPQVVYVPTYNPVTVYGGWPYPYYPPVAYYPPGYAAGAAMMSFGVGMAVGAAMWGGCHWGSNGSVTVNNTTYNNFNHATNSNPSNLNGNGNSDWNHNPEHRGNVPYGNSALQSKYGGTQPTQQERNQATADRAGLQNQAAADRNAGSQQQRQQQERSQATQDRSTLNNQARSDGYKPPDGGSRYGESRSGWGEEHPAGGGFRGFRR